MARWNRSQRSDADTSSTRTFTIGDRVTTRSPNHYHGQPGIITGWSSTGKSAHILFDHMKSSVDVQAKMLVALPPSPSGSTTTSIPSNPSFNDVKIPARTSDPGRYVRYTDVDYRAAYIAQNLAAPEHKDLTTTIDVIIESFIDLGFGSGEASVAFFRQKLETAQEAYVAHAKDSAMH